LGCFYPGKNQYQIILPFELFASAAPFSTFGRISFLPKKVGGVYFVRVKGRKNRREPLFVSMYQNGRLFPVYPRSEGMSAK
jgi:hypothetical protein